MPAACVAGRLKEGRKDMFGLKKKNSSYNKETQIPVMRVSICTGEKVVGFKDKITGKFADVMLIRNESDLNKFCKEYGVEKDHIDKMW